MKMNHVDPHFTTRQLLVACGVGLGVASSLLAQVQTVPTTDPAALSHALHATGLTITSVVIRAGLPGQFGTYSAFDLPPVSIRPGIVLSSGDVTNLGPIPGANDPDYDPSSPPAQVNSQMTPDPDTGGTTEFDDFGRHSGNIENFNASYDVAALEVHFTLDDTYNIKFDFIFGSVEYPFWTSQFTDAFLVFLDGTNVSDQVTFDASGAAVQVGSSFAGLETTADVNSAFSNPHGLIHHLTTTTPEIDRGEHVLIFEVGDVNDHILDSVAFITNLRAGVGPPGTEPSDDCPADLNDDNLVTSQDFFDFLTYFFSGDDRADFNDDEAVTSQDFFDFIVAFFAGCTS
ncbi:MAG: choice-of-anchor L domain-containing protein [Phycisphaerales bacterium]